MVKEKSSRRKIRPDEILRKMAQNDIRKLPEVSKPSFNRSSNRNRYEIKDIAEFEAGGFVRVAYVAGVCLIRPGNDSPKHLVYGSQRDENLNIEGIETIPIDSINWYASHGFN